MDRMKWYFYYLDVIKMTITLAFVGSGNGHFCHISVIDFTTSWIPFVSCIPRIHATLWLPKILQ